MWCRWEIVLSAACITLVGYESAIAAPVVNYQPGELRLVLIGLGYDIPVTGGKQTDDATRQALRNVQKRYKLKVDGVPGDRTRDLLATLVKNLQGSLNLVVKPNPPLPVNQYYGSQTKTAVKAFQKRFNLPVTGIANVEIRARIDQEAKRVLGKVPSDSPSPIVSPSPEVSPIFPSPEVSPTDTPSPEVSPIAPSPTVSPTDSPARLLSPTPITPSPAPQ